MLLRKHGQDAGVQDCYSYLPPALAVRASVCKYLDHRSRLPTNLFATRPNDLSWRPRPRRRQVDEGFEL